VSGGSDAGIHAGAPRAALLHCTLAALNSREGRATIALFVAILLARLPLALLARHRLFLGADELELTLTAADRFLGVPHTADQWPGTANHLLLLPVFAANYVVHSRFAISPASFVNYLSHFYRDPWRVFLLARLLVTAIASFGLAMLLPNLARRVGSIAVAAGGLLLLATVPRLAIVGSAAFGTGTGLGFACLAIAVALTPAGAGQFEPYVTLAAGLLGGLALAGRNLVAPVLPLVLALVAQRNKSPWRAVLVFCLAAGIGFMFACPQVWIEPIRWAKENLGNYQKPGAPIGLRAAARLCALSLPPWLLILFLAGGVGLTKQRAWFVLGGTALGVLAMIVLASGAASVPLRYYDSMTILTGVVACLGLGPLVASYLSGDRAGRLAWRHVLVGVLAALILAVNAQGTYADLAATFDTRVESVFASNGETEAFRSAIRACSHRSVLVPLDLQYWANDLASAQSLRATADHANAALRGGDSMVGFTARYGLDSAVTTALADDFNEKEQAFVARYRIMAAGDGHGDVDVAFYSRPEVARRYGLLTTDEAFSAFREGRYDALVIQRPFDASLGRIQVITPRIAIVTTH
jgi:hypothetical protein